MIFDFLKIGTAKTTIFAQILGSIKREVF
jgi:hypothetical protein